MRFLRTQKKKRRKPLSISNARSGIAHSIWCSSQLSNTWRQDAGSNVEMEFSAGSFPLYLSYLRTTKNSKHLLWSHVIVGWSGTGVQWLLFVERPLNDRALSVSLVQMNFLTSQKLGRLEQLLTPKKSFSKPMASKASLNARSYWVSMAFMTLMWVICFFSCVHTLISNTLPECILGSSQLRSAPCALVRQASFKQ